IPLRSGGWEGDHLDFRTRRMEPYLPIRWERTAKTTAYQRGVGGAKGAPCGRGEQGSLFLGKWHGPWPGPLFPALFQDWIEHRKTDQAQCGKWKSQGIFFQGPQVLRRPIFQGGCAPNNPFEG